MEGKGNGLQHGGLGKRKAVGQAIDDAGRNHNIFGEGAGAAVVRAGNSQDLAAVAEIDFSAAAGGADATKDGRIESNSVIRCESVHAGAQSSDSSGSFMPHD